MCVDHEGSQGEDATQFWFNLTTGRVEEGRQASWAHVMGPYATREEAQAALDIAKKRTQSWDDEDEAWRNS